MHSDAEHSLASYLASARKDAGSPSLRAIAAHTDYSHTTVAKAFGGNDPATLQWRIVEQITVALGATPELARRLWLAESSDGSVEPVAKEGRHPHARMLAVYAWCAVLLTGGIVIAMVQSVDRNVTHTTFVTDAVQLVFITGTAIAFGWHARRAQRDDDRRSAVFFGWLAAGASAWACGQLAWFVARNIEHEPIPSGHLHDAGYLLMPVCMGVAVWMRASSVGLSALSRPSQRVFSVVCVLGGSYAAALMIMCLLHLRLSAFELVAALYPATDLTLALLAATPLVFGRRIVGSIVLSTAFLAAAASDTAYLLVTANPSAEMIPAPAALGYIGFTAMLSLYAAVARPLPTLTRHAERRHMSIVNPRLVIDVVTGVGTVAAAVCAAIVLWQRPTTGVGIAALVATVSVASATAARMSLNSITHQAERSRRPDKPSVA